MIKYNPKSWLTFIFSFHKSDTVRILWKELIYIAILTAIITALELHFYPTSSVLKNLTSVYSLLGFVISLLLVFRTNTAYDRWWEGRKLWGSVVNDTRNLSSLLSSLDLNPSERTHYADLIIAFSKSMKEHLRRNKLDLPFPLDESASVGNQPLWIAHELRKALHELRVTDRIDAIQWQQLSRHLDQLIDSLGACERILKLLARDDENNRKIGAQERACANPCLISAKAWRDRCNSVSSATTGTPINRKD